MLKNKSIFFSTMLASKGIAVLAAGGCIHTEKNGSIDAHKMESIRQHQRKKSLLRDRAAS